MLYVVGYTDIEFNKLGQATKKSGVSFMAYFGFDIEIKSSSSIHGDHRLGTNIQLAFNNAHSFSIIGALFFIIIIM